MVNVSFCIFESNEDARSFNVADESTARIVADALRKQGYTVILGVWNEATQNMEDLD